MRSLVPVQYVRIIDMSAFSITVRFRSLKLPVFEPCDGEEDSQYSVGRRRRPQ
jgi:hypothetical protein